MYVFKVCISYIYLCSAPRVLLEKRFDTTMCLADLVMGATVYTWCWTLPSNRFTNTPDLLFSEKRMVHDRFIQLGVEIGVSEECIDTLTGIILNHHRYNIDEEHRLFTRYTYIEELTYAIRIVFIFTEVLHLFFKLQNQQS